MNTVFCYLKVLLTVQLSWKSIGCKKKMIYGDILLLLCTKWCMWLSKMYHISMDGKQKYFRKLKKWYPKWVNMHCSNLLGNVRDMKIHIEDQQEISFYDNLWPKPDCLNHSDPGTMSIFLHSSKAHFERRGNLLEQPLQMAHKPLLWVLHHHHLFFFTEPFMFLVALPVNEC